MGLVGTARGKLQALRLLAPIVRHVRNWPAVWAGVRHRGPMPPLEFRSGLRLEHAPEDDAASLLMEMFVWQQYTGDGFYRPRAGDTVFDLGANIGAFAVYLQHLARGVRVHCYEPAAGTRRRLERNVSVNGLGDLVTVHPMGVAGAAGTLTLHGNTFSGRRSVLPAAPEAAGVAETVEVVPLSEAVRRAGADRVALLKIDTEGAEVDILADADPATWAKVDRVALEFHGSLRPGAREQVEAALRAKGFVRLKVVTPTPDGRDGIIRASR